MTKAVKMRFMLRPTGTFMGVERVGEQALRHNDRGPQDRQHRLNP